MKHVFFTVGFTLTVMTASVLVAGLVLLILENRSRALCLFKHKYGAVKIPILGKGLYGREDYMFIACRREGCGKLKRPLTLGHVNIH